MAVKLWRGREVRAEKGRAKEEQDEETRWQKNLGRADRK